MKVIILGALAVFSMSVLADESTCTVPGMNCEHCVGTVAEKVCVPDKFAKCEVNYDAKTKSATIHLVTKEAQAKVDLEEINAAMADTNYKAAACNPSAPSKQGKNKKG